MNPEDRELLLRTSKLAEDNNKILHGMRRAARWGTFVHLIYWALIIGSTAATYYYLEPFLKGLTETYKKLGVPVPAFGDFNTGTLKKLLNQVRGGGSSAPMPQ